jgi:hypothetical protein
MQNLVMHLNYLLGLVLKYLLETLEQLKSFMMLA